MRDSIVIERDFDAPIDRVFKALVSPEDLIKWHHAGGGWVTPHAQVDARVGGKIKIGYSSADGAQTFEFGATISEFNPPKRLAYYLQIEDIIDKNNRQITYDLSEISGRTHLILEFDIEHVHDKELQRKGWAEHIDNLEKLLS
jgi:uncharacterized protein YndB with AHSA1/START domain